jgi:two-component system sensor histidine kinase PilS (NtrC family)
VLFQFGNDSIVLGQVYPSLYFWSASLYLLTSIGFYILNDSGIVSFKHLVELQVFSEILLLTALMHASGGFNNGLPILMVVSIITASLLVAENSSIVFAAIATTAVISESLYLKLYTIEAPDNLTQAGLLGATYFATSLFALLSARRIQQSELRAESTSADLASMERLNMKIIQFMNTGVLVVDQQKQIQFINTAAWELLEMPAQVQGKNLTEISPELAGIINHWFVTGNITTQFRQSSTGPSIQVKVSKIDDQRQDTLVFLEDTTSLTQQAQNLKLASLGRLTASIAHEIRNPLGALSHAAQLLSESEELNLADQKMVEMIEKNSQRVNNIIENVMQLSQRKTSDSQAVAIKSFIDKLIEDIQSQHNEPLNISLDISPQELKVNFDPSQLAQVLTNLIENGIRYSKQQTGHYYLRLSTSIELNSHRPYLDVMDRGPGIESDIAENIFEPFFTTSTTGSGLGLYISKELCEANRAQLDYIPTLTEGCCFRITFSRNDF